MPYLRGILTFAMLAALFPILSTRGIYIFGGADSYAPSALQCIKNSGVTQIVHYVSHQMFNSDISQFLEGMMRAKNYGLKVSILNTVCRASYPYLIAENLKRFRSVQIERYWLAPHNFTDSDCAWGSKYTPDQNCQFLEELVNQMKRNNLPFGIASNNQTWAQVFSSTCNIFSNQPLYWFLYPSITPDSSLTHFVPFGGWYTPQMKAYTCPRICNIQSPTTIFCNNIFN